MPKFSNKASVDGESLKELMELTRMQDKAVYKRLLSHSLSENDTNLLNEQLVKNLKNSLKFVRHDISHKFVHMAHIEELQDVIAHENTLQQNSPNMSHAARYTSTKEARNNNSYGRAAAA